MTTVLCLGATVLDTILRVDVIPAAPAKVLATDCVQIGSGMATSAACAVARLGGRAELWGRVGDDAAGRDVLADVAKAGVDIAHIRRIPDGRTPIATILVDGRGQRLVVPFYDPNLNSSPAWLPLARVASAEAVMVDPRWPAGAAVLLDTARAAGIPAVLDADVAPLDVLSGLLPRASHAIFSEPALCQWTGHADLDLGLRAAAERVPALVGVTAGERGFFWIEDERIRHQAAPAVVVVDTLAAGDVFHGAFALALGEGCNVAEAGRFATVAASLKCRTFGGRLGCPNRSEVSAFLGGANIV